MSKENETGPKKEEEIEFTPFPDGVDDLMARLKRGQDFVNERREEDKRRQAEFEAREHLNAKGIGSAIDIDDMDAITTKPRLLDRNIDPEHETILLSNVIKPVLRHIKSDYERDSHNQGTATWIQVGYALANYFGVDSSDAKSAFYEWCTDIDGRKLNSFNAGEFWSRIEYRKNGRSIATIFKLAHDAGYTHALRELTYSDVLKRKKSVPEIRQQLSDPTVVTTIAVLKKYIPHQYESVRSSMKECGIPFKEFDQFIGHRHFEIFKETGDKPTVVSKILELANGCKLYKTEGKETSIKVTTPEGSVENYIIETGGDLEEWLRGEFYDKFHLAPDARDLRTAIDTLKAKAKKEGELTVHCVRVGKYEDKNYIDMCDKERRVIEFTKSGWRIITDPKVTFIRYPGMRALPEPTKGGSINNLRKLLNIKTKNDDGTKNDDDFVLIVSYLLGTMLVLSEYPILNVTGAQNTAKSSFARTTRDLIDNCAYEPGAPPKNDEDYYISLKGRHIGIVDNLSSINQHESDRYARIATGGAMSQRKKYTDAQESVISIVRPQIFTGINNCARSGDLASRCLHIELEKIPSEMMLGRNELQAKFESLHPEVLGALLDIIVVGLGRIANVELPKSTMIRMPDFIKLAIACEQGYGMEAGAFLKSYGVAAESAAEDLLEGQPVFIALARLLAKQVANGKTTKLKFEGTFNELHQMLHKPELQRDIYWPANGQALSRWFKRNIPDMEKIGCIAKQGQNKKGSYVGIEMTQEIVDRFKVIDGEY
jgi:hypothetical protein